jgi:antitoxin component YwqK of YwqJK toxin-antitoxin module
MPPRQSPPPEADGPAGDRAPEARASEPVPDVAYYDDGGVRYRGFQLDGEMHGAWEFLRKDGSLMRAGEFNRGKQVGVWRTYDRSGRVVKETDFSGSR